jgi:hypothetical protein
VSICAVLFVKPKAAEILGKHFSLIFMSMANVWEDWDFAHQAYAC